MAEVVVQGWMSGVVVGGFRASMGVGVSGVVARSRRGVREGG